MGDEKNPISFYELGNGRALVGSGSAGAVYGREHRVVDANTGGEKGSKIERFDLIPPLAIEEIARVYGFGAQKYEDRNWEKGYKWGLSFAAMMRHAWSFWRGETYDKQSGLHHLAHVAFHCMAMITWHETHPELDDRLTTKRQESNELRTNKMV